MSAESKRVHVVVVTYRRPRKLRALVDLLTQSEIISTVVVVDNEPLPQNEETVLRLPSNVRGVYMPMSENAGPAGGFAIGVPSATALAASEDWVLLVDDDHPPHPTEIERLWLFGEQMVADDPHTGGVGRAGSRLGRFGRLRRVSNDELVGPVRVDTIAGGSIPLYRVKALHAVGTFDEQLFFGFEELEFGLRMQSGGWSLYIDGPMLLKHRTRLGLTDDRRRQGVPSQKPAWRRYYSVRNLIHIIRRHRSTILAAWVSTLLLFRAAFAVVTPRGGLDDARMTVDGIRDGWMGRLGRRIDPPRGALQ